MWASSWEECFTHRLGTLAGRLEGQPVGGCHIFERRIKKLDMCSFGQAIFALSHYTRRSAKAHLES